VMLTIELHNPQGCFTLQKKCSLLNECGVGEGTTRGEREVGKRDECV
jgi:hypothetical protein